MSKDDIILKFGDCRKMLKKIDEKSISLIFADPPYNLSGKNYLTVKSGKPVQGYKGEWDVVEDYLKFTGENGFLSVLEFLEMMEQYGFQEPCIITQSLVLH